MAANVVLWALCVANCWKTASDAASSWRALPPSFKRSVGHREKITLDASGNVVLAFSLDAECYLAELVADQDRPAYRQELARIQTVGYAVSKDELIQGAVAMAAPVFSGGAKEMGSLAVYGSSVHVDQSNLEKIVELLLEESSALSKTIGL